MKLQQKYDQLIQTAKLSGVQNLQVREQENVLYIDGQAPSQEVKQQLWDVYGKIDPNYRSADVVMNIAVSPITPATGRNMTIHGGQAGTSVGKYNPNSERSFDARHDATGMTPKKYVNKLRWDNKARIGSIVRIPDRLFKSKTV